MAAVTQHVVDNDNAHGGDDGDSSVHPRCTGSTIAVDRVASYQSAPIGDLVTYSVPRVVVNEVAKDLEASRAAGVAQIPLPTFS